MFNKLNKLNPMAQLNPLGQLKDLKSAQSQVSQRDTQRQGAARTQYDQATELLKVYNRTLDKQTLRQCMLLLTECIRTSRSFPEPYILLGYVYHALRLPQLALKYLRVAEHLQRDNPTLIKLKQAILEGHQAPVVSRRKPGGSAFELLDLENVDHDALYDELESLIAREVQTAMDIPVPVRPTASKDVIAELTGYQGSLEQVLELVNTQLEIVEEEIDCAPLRSRLRLIESRWRQLTTLIEQCRNALELQRALLTAMSDIQIELFEPAPSEARLETFLDLCDAFADKIDEIDSKGLNISALKADYEALAEGINQLQDRLDS